MTQNRAPYALPAVIAGAVAVALAVFLSALLGLMVGLAATIMGGMAYADTKSHGYDGAEMALVGAALGVVAVVLFFVTVVVM